MNMTCDDCGEEEDNLLPRMYDTSIFFYCRDCAPRHKIDPQEGVVD